MSSYNPNNTQFTESGAVAYTTTIHPDGRTEVTGVGSEVPAGQMGDIATPDGPSFKRTDGYILGQDELNPTATPEGVGENIKTTIGADPAYQINDVKRNVLDNLDPAHAIAHVTGVDPGKGLDNAINNKIYKTAQQVAGPPGGTASPTATSTVTSTLPNMTTPGALPPSAAANMATNVAGTANRTGTQAAAPTPITAPDNGFRASLTAGTVDQQSAITAGSIQAGQSTAGQAGYAPSVQATTINAPDNGFKAGVTAGTVGVQGDIKSQQITAPQNNFKPGVTAGTVGEQAPIVGQTIGSTLSPDQQRSIELAKGQAEGTAPSAAQALLQKGIDQNVGTAYGLAASLSGRNAGQALLQGSSSAQTAIAKSSADMAALRAQEIQKGTETYGAFSSTAAGQELARQQSNQSTDLQAKIQTTTNTINVLTGNRDAALKAGLQNQADALTAQIENQKEQLSALQSNATNDLTAKIQSVTNTINVLTGNRDAALKAGLQNQADTLQAQINNANNQLAALQSNQATALAASTSNAANINAVNISNAGNVTSANNVSATNATQANIAAAANQLTAQIQTAQNNIHVLEGNRDAALKAGMQNQADTLTSQINNANNSLDAMKSNLAAVTQTNISNAGNATQMSVADLDAYSKAMALNDSDRQEIAKEGLAAWIASLDAATKNRAISVAAQTAANSADAEFWGKIIGGLATVGGAYIAASARRLKTTVADGAKDVGRFLDSLTSQTWDYRDPEKDGAGRRLGVMAQDAGSTRMGRSFVVELPDGRGRLGLDPAKAIGPVLAGLASINARLKKIEGRRG